MAKRQHLERDHCQLARRQVATVQVEANRFTQLLGVFWRVLKEGHAFLRFHHENGFKGPGMAFSRVFGGKGSSP